MTTNKIQSQNRSVNDGNHNLLNKTQFAKLLHPSFDSRVYNNLVKDGYISKVYELQVKSSYFIPKYLVDDVIQGIYHKKIILRPR